MVYVNLSTLSRIDDRDKVVSHCMRLSPTSIKRWKTRCGCVRMIHTSCKNDRLRLDAVFMLTGCRASSSTYLENSPREYGVRGGAVNIPISRTSFENSPPGFVTSQLPSRFTARQRRETFERLASKVVLRSQ